MSESLTLELSTMRRDGTAKPVAKRGFGAWFMTALESLVAAQSRGIDESGSLFFRYPPI